MRWRQSSPVRATFAKLQEILQEISPLWRRCPSGDISQSIARHAFPLLRVSTLASRAATQTLLAPRRWVMCRKRRRTEELERSRVPECGMPGICSADVARHRALHTAVHRLPPMFNVETKIINDECPASLTPPRQISTPSVRRYRNINLRQTFPEKAHSLLNGRINVL